MWLVDRDDVFGRHKYLLHYHEEPEPSGQRKSHIVSFSDEGKKERGSSAVPGTTGRPAEVLREESRIKVDGLTISTYIKDARSLPGPFTIRGCSPKAATSSERLALYEDSNEFTDQGEPEDQCEKNEANGIIDRR